MAGGRPATPMYPAPSPGHDGALSYADAAAFLAISVRMLEVLIASGEIEVVYERSKPRVLKRQLIERLERQLEESRAERARSQ